MTDQEKIDIFNRIQKELWEAVISGNPLQSLMASAWIRKFNIIGPNDEDPEES